MTGDKRKIDLSTRESRSMVRSTLAGLHSSEAWKLFDAYLEGEELRLTDAIANCSVPNEVLRDAGRLKAVREMRKWPVTMVANIDHMNKQQEAAEKAEKERADHGPEGQPHRPHFDR